MWMKQNSTSHTADLILRKLNLFQEERQKVKGTQVYKKEKEKKKKRNITPCK